MRVLIKQDFGTKFKPPKKEVFIINLLTVFVFNIIFDDLKKWEK